MCRLASRRLLELDDIVGEVVAYGGPAAGMILLCSAVNSTVMMYLAISKFNYYYLAFITLKVLSVVQVTFVPDTVLCKREESLRLIRRQLACNLHCPAVEAALKDVEKVVAGSTTFRVCRLFTLDRHIILSVASSVVTYLVIALQFGVSEIPGRRSQAAVNCSAT
ncbi:uncharacterized protein LOC127007213 [Eriocheir sinensis]|uniref:uncharacterized protein LOC127007213 n=1 Tax=Eriocheir sinensis TaxID=95602 RepID=UPI0021C7C594|nr:uncharacterized protein LOC127007213 [Eriocheir sinensis]